MPRATLLALLVALYALPAWSAGEGCDPAQGWTPGTPCTPADNVGLEVTPGSVSKSLQEAYDDGDLGAGGSTGVDFPDTTFANLGTSPCLENPGVTCQVTDSESCTSADALETGDVPALCRWALVQGGSPAWTEIGPALGNDEVPITTDLLEGDGFGDATPSGVTAAQVTANTAHAASTSDPHSVTAAQVSSTPSGDVAASDVDSAIAELASEKATGAALTSHTTDTTNPHTVTAAQIGVEAGSTADQVASEVPVTPVGNLTSTQVQAALEEHQSDIDTLAIGGDGLGPDGDKGDITVGASGTTLQIDAGAVTSVEVDTTICKADGTDCAASGDEVPITSAILRGDGAGDAEASSMVWDVTGGDVSGLNAAIAACDASANGGVIQVGAGRFDFLTTAINDWGGGTTGGCEIRGQGSHSTVFVTRKDAADGTDFWTTTHRGPSQPLKGSGFGICAVCDAGGGACVPEPGALLSLNPGGANTRVGRNIHTYLHDVQIDNDCGEWTSGGGLTFEGIEGDAIGTATCITGGACLGKALRVNHTLFGVLSKTYLYNAADCLYTEPNAAVTTLSMTNESRIQACVDGVHFDNSTGTTLSPKLFLTDSTVEGNSTTGVRIESYAGGNCAFDSKGVHYETIAAGTDQVVLSNCYGSIVGGRFNGSATGPDRHVRQEGGTAYRVSVSDAVMGRAGGDTECQIENNGAGVLNISQPGDYDVVNAGIVTCGTNTDDITINGHYRLANCTSAPTLILAGQTCTDSGGTNVGVTYEYDGTSMVPVTVADNAITGAKIAMGSDALGDTIAYNGTDYIRVPIGTADQVLGVSAGQVAWETIAGGAGGNISDGTIDADDIATGGITAADAAADMATQAEIDLKANLASPVFTGDPTSTTDPPVDDSDQSIPTTAWVQAEIAAGGGGDVSGPASSTDNGLVTFSGTTGKVIQDNSGCTLSDTGALDCPAPATDGGELTIKEGADDGTNTFKISIPATGLSASLDCELDATGKIPDACILNPGGTETNSLETTITGIASGEVFVGNGVDSGTFRVLTESDISDLGTYLTAETNDLEAQDPPTIASGEVYVGTGPGAGAFRVLTESDISDLGTYLTSEVNNLETNDPPNVQSGEVYVGTGAGAGAWRVLTESDISDLQSYLTAETNSLETTITGIADAEVFVGTGANAGAFIAGLAACAADEKIEYVPGAPDTFTCEPIGSLLEADISDLSHTTDTTCSSAACTVGTDDTITIEGGTTLTAIADTELLIGTGPGTAAYAAMSGDGTLSNAGVFALAIDTVGLAELAACTSGVVEYTAGVPACLATPGSIDLYSNDTLITAAITDLEFVTAEFSVVDEGSNRGRVGLASVVTQLGQTIELSEMESDVADQTGNETISGAWNFTTAFTAVHLGTFASWTPTVTGTGTANLSTWKRLTDSVVINVKLTKNTGAGTLQFTLPSGMVLNASAGDFVGFCRGSTTQVLPLQVGTTSRLDITTSMAIGETAECKHLMARVTTWP